MGDIATEISLYMAVWSILGGLLAGVVGSLLIYLLTYRINKKIEQNPAGELNNSERHDKIIIYLMILIAGIELVFFIAFPLALADTIKNSPDPINPQNYNFTVDLSCSSNNCTGYAANSPIFSCPPIECPLPKPPNVEFICAATPLLPSSSIEGLREFMNN
jgi:MFS family permease